MTSLPHLRFHPLHSHERQNSTCERNFPPANSYREGEHEGKVEVGGGAAGGGGQGGRLVEAGRGEGARSLFRTIRSFKELLKRFKKKITVSG